MRIEATREEKANKGWRNEWKKEAGKDGKEKKERKKLWRQWQNIKGEYESYWVMARSLIFKQKFQYSKITVNILYKENKNIL